MRHGKILAVFLVAASALAGCTGGGDLPDTVGRDAAVRPCEHPWPCGDGTEWPADLVAPQHPRQPPVLPDDMRIDGAELLERTPARAVFSWRVPTVDAVDLRATDAATLNPTETLKVRVPEGLFLDWSLGVTVPGDGDAGGRSYDLTLSDERGEPLCFTDHDVAVLGAQSGDDNLGCSTGPLGPLGAPAEYALELQHEFDRRGSEIVVQITVEVAEPFLSFERDPVLPVRVAMPDGIELEGGVWLPRLPEGVRAPVVLYTSPYFAQCSAQSEFLGCGPGPADAAYLGVYGLGALLREGYAIAVFNVRGTGASGGCYDAWGPIEQGDHVALVQWLAEQSWSNGRVGMTGLSYAGTTPWEAAIHAAPALKAIVVGGIISDVYLGGFTPQGAANDGALYFHGSTAVANSLQPPRGGDPATLGRYAPGAPGRVCADTEREILAHPEGVATDARDATWFGERRLLDRFADVTAAALVLHGVEDDNFHRYQEDVIWDTLPNAPKAMVLGQWDHTIDLEPFLENHDGPRSWHGMAKSWFDYWLKGLGDPPTMLGTVSYQTTDMAWRQDTAWPPTAAREEVLFLADGALQPEPGGAAGFHAVRSPTAVGARAGNPRLCDPAPVEPEGRWLVHATEPLTEDIVIGGNPMAYLGLTSDQPGGVVTVDLYALAPDGTCAEVLTEGAADLRFHAGNMEGQDFPVQTETPVRVDLYSTAARVPAGHRLVALLSGGGQDYKQGQAQYEPQVEVSGESHLVLPLVEGTLGGRPPETAYPPRPFAPAA